MEDEVVVMEGTPLAGHLRDVGYIDDIEVLEENIPNVEGQPWWKKMFEAIREAIADQNSIVRNSFENLSVTEILKSDISDEVDLVPIFAERGFLTTMSEDIVLKMFLKRALRDVVISVIPSAVMGFSVKRSLAAKILMASPVAAVLLRWMPAISATVEYKKLKYFLRNANKFGKQIRQASRIINENALVNRGYMLTKNNASTAWKLETKSLLTVLHLSEKCLPGLRIAVVDSVSRLAMCYSEELELLRTQKPLGYYLEHESIRLPPVDDINEVLGIESQESVPELHVIKKSIDVMMVKEREYIRRLLTQMLTEQKGRFSVPIGPKLLSTLRESIQEMEMAVLLNKTFFVHNEECHFKTSKPEDGPQGALHSVCRSARLHLEGALKEANAVENAFEISDLEPAAFNILMRLPLNRMQFHMESAKECLLQASVMVNKSTGNVDSLDSKVVKNAGNVNHRSDNEDEDEEYNALREIHVPKDEIFEMIGERSSDDFEDEDEIEGLDIASSRECSRLMMSELKGVLRIKAQDWEEREKKLRELSKSGPMEDSNQDDRSSTPSREGDFTGSSMTSWVVPSFVDARSPIDLDSVQLEVGDRLDPKLLGSIASAAVEKVKTNQEIGLLKANEEEFVIPGDEEYL